MIGRASRTDHAGAADHGPLNRSAAHTFGGADLRLTLKRRFGSIVRRRWVG